MKFFKAVAAVVLAGPATLAACQNIIATAQSAGFNTLVAAIDTAGLTDTFTQDGPGASVYSKSYFSMSMGHLKRQRSPGKST